MEENSLSLFCSSVTGTDEIPQLYNIKRKIEWNAMFGILWTFIFSKIIKSDPSFTSRLEWHDKYQASRHWLYLSESKIDTWKLKLCHVKVFSPKVQIEYIFLKNIQFNVYTLIALPTWVFLKYLHVILVPWNIIF